MDRIDALRLLLDVRESRSFSATARKRGIATSTVTSAVTQIEQETGTRLLTRSTRKLALTHEGERFVEDALRVVSAWDLAVASMRHDGPLTGPIRITATNDFGRNQLRPMLDAFQRLHPAVHVSLVLGDDTIDLLGGQLDLALRYGPLQDSGLHARRLVGDQRLVCASPVYWAQRGKPAHPSELVQHNCLVLARPESPLANWPFRVGGQTVHVKVSGDRQASDGDILREWAVEGVGIAFKNGWDVRAELEAGLLETALEDFSAGEVNLYAVHPGNPSRRVVALLEFITERLSRLARDE